MYFVKSCAPWMSWLAISVCAGALLSGCGGVSAPSAKGPAFNGDTGFTTAASTQIWQKTFGPTSSITTLGGIAVDAAGNVIVAGSTNGAFPGFTNASQIQQDCVAKFDPSGNLLWAQQLGTGSGDAFYAVATDASGNIFAVGATRGVFPAGTGSGGSGALVIAKFSTSGQLVWLQQYPSSFPTAVAVAPDGNVLVSGAVGSLNNSGSTTPSAFSGSFIWKVNSSNGNLQWQQSLSSFAFSFISGIAADYQGNVLAAGRSSPSNATNFQPLVVKLSGATGALLWNQSLPLPSYAVGAMVTGIAVDTQNNPVVTGDDFALYSTNGTVGPGCFLAKLNGESGTSLWITPFGTPAGTSAGTTSMDAQGNVIVAGMTEASLLPAFTALTNNIFLAKFNSSGTNLWLQQYSDGSNLQFNVVSEFVPATSFPPYVAVDTTGNIYAGETAAPTVRTASGNGYLVVPFLAKFGP